MKLKKFFTGALIGVGVAVFVLSGAINGTKYSYKGSSVLTDAQLADLRTKPDYHEVEVIPIPPVGGGTIVAYKFNSGDGSLTYLTKTTNLDFYSPGMIAILLTIGALIGGAAWSQEERS